jgi:hypothetical protein
MNSLNSFKTNKFKKGDKILGKNCEGLGMYAGKTYTVKTCTESEMTLEECFCKETGRNYTFTPSMYELIEKRNFREMCPNDLITDQLMVLNQKYL